MIVQQSISLLFSGSPPTQTDCPVHCPHSVPPHHGEDFSPDASALYRSGQISHPVPSLSAVKALCVLPEAAVEVQAWRLYI